MCNNNTLMFQSMNGLPPIAESPLHIRFPSIWIRAIFSRATANSTELGAFAVNKISTIGVPMQTKRDELGRNSKGRLLDEALVLPPLQIVVHQIIEIVPKMTDECSKASRLSCLLSPKDIARDIVLVLTRHKLIQSSQKHLHTRNSPIIVQCKVRLNRRPLNILYRSVFFVPEKFQQSFSEKS